MGKFVKGIIAVTLLAFSGLSGAQQVLDRVAVVVNDGIVLESEVEQLVQQVKHSLSQSGTQLPSDKVLRIQAMDRLVLSELQFQIAKRMGITISDQQLQQGLTMIAQEQDITVDQLRENISRMGNDWDTYREA